MTNPGVLDSQGNEVPEGIIDATQFALLCMTLIKMAYIKTQKLEALYCKTKNAWS